MTARPIRNCDVLFLAGDPGGASALLPVIQEWHGSKVILAYRQAVDLFQREGLVFERLDDARASIFKAGAFLERKRPGLVCAATSVNGVDWERYFFVASRKLGIPSAAVLDYWSNYVPRFTLAQHLDALPDVIGIMDERARIEMIEHGFPAERLVIAGQPVLDGVRKWHADLSVDSRRRFREQLGLAADTRAFLFISQPLREMRLATGDDGRPYDDEFAALKELARTVAIAPAASKLLLIKLHPREEADKFQHLIPSLPCPVRLVEPQFHRWEVCMAADCVFGIDSMLMEEALVMGCPVARIQHHVLSSIDSSEESRKRAFDHSLPLAKDLIAQIIKRHLRTETAPPV